MMKVKGCKHYESKVMTAHAKGGGPIATAASAANTQKVTPAAQFFMRASSGGGGGYSAPSMPGRRLNRYTMS